MDTIRPELRRVIVKSYKSGLSSTYAEIASFFEIGEATVSRYLRRDREGDDLSTKQWGGIRVSKGTMSQAMRDIGWSYKKTVIV